MAERMTRREAWSYIERVLASGKVAEKGHIACVELATGEITPAATDTTLRPIGVFDQNLTGDGTATVRVRLFREIWLDRYDNSAADPIADADFGELCYLEDSETVALTSGTNTRSVAGRIWGVTSAGVLVEMGAP